MSERLYRLVESGSTNVTAATLTRLAEAFGVDVATLLAPIRQTSARLRPPHEGPSTMPVAPSVAASLLLDPATLRDPAVAAALDSLLRRRSQPERVSNPSSGAASDAAERPSATPGEGDKVNSRVTSSIIEVPVVPKESDMRAFLIALLVANPRGLLTAEMAEAAATAKRRHRKNEIHEIVRALQESGDLMREGRRGSFVYSLRRASVAAH